MLGVSEDSDVFWGTPHFAADVDDVVVAAGELGAAEVAYDEGGEIGSFSGCVPFQEDVLGFDVCVDDGLVLWVFGVLTVLAVAETVVDEGHGVEEFDCGVEDEFVRHSSGLVEEVFHLAVQVAALTEFGE